MMDISKFDAETKQRVFQQAIDLFVAPEIDRRKKIKKLPANFNLEKAQIIFSSKTGRICTRLNKEVKAVIKCKVNRAIKKGDAVYDKDIDNIESVKLTDRDLNYGHITLLYFKGSWIVSFDFIYNKLEIKKHIEASKEFYESAKDNSEKNRLRPFYENAFASAELFTKSILLSLPIKESSKGSKHKSRKDFLENWANLGNVKPEFSTTLSKLYSLRNSARYLASEDFKKESPKEIIGVLEEMISFWENRENDKNA